MDASCAPGARQLFSHKVVQLPVKPITRLLSLAAVALLLASALVYSRQHPPQASAATITPSAPRPGWPTFHGNYQRSGSSGPSDGPSTTPKILWTFREHDGAPSDFSASPAVVEGRVYVASGNIDVVSRSGFIYCFDAKTGRQIWRVGTNQEVYSSPAVVDGRVYVGEGLHENTNSHLRCLDAATGRLIWQFKVASHAEGPPTIHGGRCYFSAGDDGIYCLDAASGKKIWQLPGYHIDESPIVTGNTVLVGSGYDRASYLAIHATSGELLWHRPMEASVWGTSALSGDRVYFGLSNAQVGGAGPADLGRVHCVDIHTGHDIWTYKLPRAVGTSLVVADNQVFFGCWDGNLYCLNRTTGSFEWKTDTGGPLNSSPAVDSKRLYLGTSSGRVLALSRKTGQINWSLAVPSTAIDPAQILSSPALVDGRLYVGATNNQFLCIGETR
jgi:outer membrane protein assembly factor BamB